jgi:small-conductance mechanosensitive channel
VDLQERHQLDAAREHVARVKARTRPWRYIFALVLAMVAAAISAEARRTADLLALPGTPKTTTWLSALGQSGNRILEYGTAVAFFLLAGAATIGLGNKARDILQPSVGSAHAGIVRFAVVLAGGLATIIITLQLFSIAVTQLVVGGALTGVLVGIAAQQSLANVFAGIVLLMARPFQVGDTVGIRSGALSGLIEGTVSEVSVTYVRLETENGPIHLPNAQVLAAAVGPVGAVPSPLVLPPSAAGPAPAAPPSAAPATPPGPTGPGSAPADPAALPPGVPGAPTGPERPTAPQPPGEQAAQRDADHPAS